MSFHCKLNCCGIKETFLATYVYYVKNRMCVVKSVPLAHIFPFLMVTSVLPYSSPNNAPSAIAVILECSPAPQHSNKYIHLSAGLDKVDNKKFSLLPSFANY